MFSGNSEHWKNNFYDLDVFRKPVKCSKLATYTGNYVIIRAAFSGVFCDWGKNTKIDNATLFCKDFINTTSWLLS